MENPNRGAVSVATLLLIGLLCSAAKGQNIIPPSQLPSNTPAAYNLIVPVVGQQQSEWCWAASDQMVYNYVDPLPVVQQCLEANAMFNPNGPEPQAGWSDCCVTGSSSACDQGDGGPNPQYPYIDLHGNSTGSSTLTWDQLRYQIWVNNEPFTFGWTWYPVTPTSGAHVQVVTGYETDAQGNRWVYVNNPIPVGQGDFECMSYDEWSQDTSTSDPYGAHTHEGDWFDPTYNSSQNSSQPQLIYNLPTNGVMPVVGLTEAQAPNLAGTVISDRMVPFTIGGLFQTSGQIQERVVQENGTQTLDFYYRIMNSGGGDITQLTIQNFERATVAVAYRPDSLGTLPAQKASRDVTGSDIQVYLQPIPPGQSSHFILLMTDATASNDQGSMGITTTAQIPWVGITGHAQIATDQPTAIPMTTANASVCPVMTQPLIQAIANVAGGSAEALQGLPKRLESDAVGSAQRTAAAALPRNLSTGAVGAPIQIADVALNQLAAYQRGQPIDSLVHPLTGLIVPVHLSGDNYLGVFLKGSGSHYVPVGMGEPNMTRLLVQTIAAVAKEYNVSPDSLTVLRVPGLFLTFVARPEAGKTWLIPVSSVQTYDLRSGEEVNAEDAFVRLQPAAQHHHTSDLSRGPKRTYEIPK